MTATARRGISPKPGLPLSLEWELRARALDAENRAKAADRKARKYRAEIVGIGGLLLKEIFARETAERRALELSQQVDAYRAGKKPRAGRVYRNPQLCVWRGEP